MHRLDYIDGGSGNVRPDSVGIVFQDRVAKAGRGPRDMVRESGFVLAATLWVLALLTIGAGFIAEWTGEAVEQAWELQQQVEESIEMQGSLAVILYLLASRPLTEAGLVLPDAKQPFAAATISADLFARRGTGGGLVLSLDDQAYQGIGSIAFSLQDEGGLIGVNGDVPALLDGLLRLDGIAAADRDLLNARLEDYLDFDDLYRLNGAERREYARMGLPAPANRPLLTPWEVAGVLGWQEHEALWRPPPVPRMINTVWRRWPNFNTAPRQVLRSWPLLGSGEEDRIIEARRIRPFLNEDDVYAALGRYISGASQNFGFFPSKYLRITLWSKEGHRVREIHLKLTPFDDGRRPWLVDYQLDYARSRLPDLGEPDDQGISLFESDINQ